jgi:septum formation topological specificity factor MinE
MRRMMTKRLILNEVRNSDSVTRLINAESKLLKVIDKYNNIHRSQLQMWSRIDLGEVNKLTVKIYKICS